MNTRKYPSKRKRKGYWKIYDKARIKDFRKVWNFAIEIVNEQDCPFVKKDKRGRKPKFPRHYYAVFCIVMVCFDMSLREMEGMIPLLAGNSLDHSVVDWWFEKLDDDWVAETVRTLGDKIEAMFKKSEYIADSTKYTTTRYQEIIDTGKKELEHLTMKLHILTAYFPSVGIICIKNVHATHGDANDNPILRENLLENVKLRKKRRLHADKGYWSKGNIRASKNKRLKPNIVPKENTKHSLTLITAMKEYDNEARKANRGIIEGIFGGTTTDTDNITRFVKDRCRKTHLTLCALTHQIRTYFRALEIKTQTIIHIILRQPLSQAVILVFLFLSRTSPSKTKEQKLPPQ